jgi:hypothetical protein
LGPRPLVDLGATALSGAGSLPRPMGHQNWLKWTDCVRLGLADPAAAAPGSSLPRQLLSHLTAVTGWSGEESPLANWTAAKVRRLPQPFLDPAIERPPSPAGRERLVILDAPAPGLFGLCAGLRGRWQFLEDIADRAPIVEVLLDWAVEYVAGAYQRLLRTPVEPDLVLWGDDLADGHGPFISPEVFERLLAPRLMGLFEHLNRRGEAAVLLHTCGNVGPLLKNLLALPIRALSVEHALLGGVPTLRRAVASELVLYGIVPLVRLGGAIRRGDSAAVNCLLEDAEAARPLIAADEATSFHTASDAALAAELLAQSPLGGGTSFCQRNPTLYLPDSRERKPPCAKCSKASHPASRATNRQEETWGQQ